MRKSLRTKLMAVVTVQMGLLMALMGWMASHWERWSALRANVWSAATTPAALGPGETLGMLSASWLAVAGMVATIGLTLWLIWRIAGGLDRHQKQEFHSRRPQLQLIIDSIAGCIAYNDADQRYQFVNQTYADWFSCTKEEVLGRTVREFLGEVAYARVQGYIERALTGEQVSYEVELPYLLGGTRYVSVTLVPDWGENAEVRGYYALLTDISDRKRIELALADSETKLRNVLDNATASIVQLRLETDERWAYEYMSPGCEQVYGYTCQEFLADPSLWCSRVLPEDRNQVIAPSWQRMLAGQPHQCEYRLRHKNGETIWLRATVNPQWDPVQQNWLVTIVNLDISEHQRMEAALRHSEAKQRAIINTLPDLLLRVNRAGVYLDVWPTDSFRLIGETSEVVGNHIEQMLPPSLAQRRLAAVRAAVDTQQMQVYEQMVTFEDTYQIEEVRVVACGDDEAIVLVRDMSDRIRAEARLREREASLREFNRRWSTLLNEVQLMVVQLDAQGRIAYANPFFLKRTGYQAEEAMGRDWFEGWVPADRRADMRARYQQLLQGPPADRSPPDRILTKAGEQRTVAWTKTQLRDTQDCPIGLISIGQDITEQCHLESMKSEFITMVSHELRTPLASVQTALSLLESHAVDLTTTDSQQVIAIANQAVERLVRLVNNILDLRRLEMGQLWLEKKWFQGADVAIAAIQQMWPMAQQAGITLAYSRAKGPLYGDPELILQVLVNLLGNAIKFSPQNTTVSLHLQMFAERGCFAVVDRGRGISAGHLDLIFDRFYQVDTSDARQKGGSGLGLAICRQIVGQHGGDIWAESALGRGSTFYVSLPRPGRESRDS